MFTSNYHLTIEHPETGDEVDARVAFSYYKGYAGSIDSPPEPKEIELVSVHVDGRDITHLFTAAQIEYVEGLLLCSEYNAPDDENYIDEQEYSNYN